MKKFALILMLCFCFMFVFSACEDDSKFWLETKSKIDELFSEENEVVLIDILTYSSAVQTVVNNNSSDFSSLKQYDNLLKISLVATKNFYSGFSIVPDEVNRKSSSEHKTLRTKTDETIEKIEEFKSKKDNFENSLNLIAGTENLNTSTNAKQILLEFQRDFANIIYECNEFNLQFIKTFELSFSNLFKNNSSKFIMEFSAYKTLAELTDAYLYYAYKEHNGNFVLKGNEFYSRLTEFLSKVIAATDFDTANYDQWKETTSLFLEEKSMFIQALQYVDLAKLPQNTDTLTIAYLNKIKLFCENGNLSYIKKYIDASEKLIKN